MKMGLVKALIFKRCSPLKKSLPPPFSGNMGYCKLVHLLMHRALKVASQSSLLLLEEEEEEVR